MISKFIILGIIIFIKAIFASSETAFTYLNKAKFNQMSKNNKNKSRLKILKIKEFLDNKIKLFGTAKVGMTLAELFASAFAAETFVRELKEQFEIIGLNTNWGYGLSIVIVTLILSYFTLVFGELIPKRIARNNPERVAYRTIGCLAIFSKIIFVFEKFIQESEKLFAKIFGIKNEPSEKLTEKELKMIIAEGKDQGLLDENEKKLLYNALKFDDLKIKDIMIEKENMVFINEEYTKEKIFEIIKKYRYTRIPVYAKTRNNIIGVLNIKDLLVKSLNEKGKLDINLKELLREPIYVTKDENINKIFSAMQVNNKQIAIVKDENNKVIGMITMEDIIEKLLGNIIDEFD